MKKILASAVLATAIASPAVAQTARHFDTYPSVQYTPNGHHEYIYPPDNHAHSANPAHDVYDDRGRYIGSDPDPFIRDSLARGRSND